MLSKYRQDASHLIPGLNDPRLASQRSRCPETHRSKLVRANLEPCLGKIPHLFRVLKTPRFLSPREGFKTLLGTALSNGTLRTRSQMLPASVESSPQFWQKDNKMYFDITLKNIDINNRNDRVKIKTYITGQSITNPRQIIICHPFPKI